MSVRVRDHRTRGHSSFIPPGATLSAFPAIPPALWTRLDALEAQHAQLRAQLDDPVIAADHRRARDISIQKAAIDDLVTSGQRLRALRREHEEMSLAASGKDREFAALAAEELPRVAADAARLVDSVRSQLVNTEDNKVGSVIVEVRAGTGGDEAALWARDILEMLQKYAVKRAWTVELLDMTVESSAGGIRNAVLNVKGPGVWTALNFEAGVHSVKRVPATEAQGRVHTSTATIAVLPEPQEVDVKIDWAKDVEENVTTSQGPGGQNVNKVATAVQLHHKPSGIIIRMQESKSQQQNRERAKRLLMAKLHEIERQKVHAQRTAARSAQIGVGDRSEKVRTYRYKEGIVADERLPDEYPLRDLLAGDFAKLHAALIEQETARRLAAM